MNKIEKRLKAAYDNVGFYSNSTWISSSHLYQRVNQELFVRELKLQDVLQRVPLRTRTVRDSIPNSRLAQYANYEYNESRELCYASGVSDISFYYPCAFKRDFINEPWMLPEVEQLFIWLTYSSEFDISDPIGLEDLNHLDDQERLAAGLKQSCSSGIFHEIKPVIYNNTERTPGKARYTKERSLTNEDEIKFSNVMKYDDVESIILSMRINSEKVRNLWKCNTFQSDIKNTRVSPPQLPEKKFNIFKSPLGNYFVFENVRNVRNIPNLIRIELKSNTETLSTDKNNDLQNLEELTRQIESLQKWLLDDEEEELKDEEKSVISEVKETSSSDIHNTKSCAKSTQTSGKRLYSAVLQGLSAEESCNKQEQCEQLPKISEADYSVKENTLFETFLNNNTENEINIVEKQKTNVAEKEERFSYILQSHLNQENPTNQNKIHNNILKESTELPNQQTKTTKEANYATGVCSTSQSSNMYNSANYTSYPSGSTTLPTCPYTNFHNPGLYGNYINNNYIINVCPNNAYLTPYPNNYYINSQNTNRSVPQLIRQPYASNAVHVSQPVWYVQQQKAQSYYPMRNYHAQPFMYLSNPPPLKTTQRWTTPILKTQTQPSYSSPTPSTPPQLWNGVQGQNLLRNNSTQLLSSNHQSYGYGYSRDGSKSISKSQNFGNFVVKHQCNKSDKYQSWSDDQNEYKNSCSLANNRCSPYSTASCCASENNIAAEHNLHCQEELYKTEEESCYQSEDNFSSLTSLTSDDLEKQALEQYSGSNESFYRELEQQATEQYEESGNWMRPPNNSELFGGLSMVNLFLYCKLCLVYYNYII